jgi:hypothetical protein
MQQPLRGKAFRALRMPHEKENKLCFEEAMAFKLYVVKD